jgi:dTDP-4-amino-4,6-dideoxygalactose transaminase
LGACGEAGAVTTNAAEVVCKIRMIRDHGQSRKYFHDVEGYNGRLDAIQPGILHTKLGHFKSWNQQRRLKAAEYNRLLSDCDAIGLPYEPSWSRGVSHLYGIRTSDREGLMKHLKEAAIDSAIHHPVPLHLQSAYVSLNYSADDFPVTESAAAEILSLPMFPQLTSAQQEKVAAQVTSFSTKLQQKSAEVELGTLIPVEPIA